jgi:hypothetical protein
MILLTKNLLTCFKTCKKIIMQISRKNGKSKCLFYVTKEKHERKKIPIKKNPILQLHKKT